MLTLSVVDRRLTTIKLVFASSLSISINEGKQRLVGSESGCQSGEMCLLMDCCFSEKNPTKRCWSSTKTSSLSH